MTATDGEGAFKISSLTPGNYSVKISAAGMSDWSKVNVPASATPEPNPVLAVLQVAPEVSSLDFANGLTIQGFNVPALTTRKVKTEVELSDGQSFAIGGPRLATPQSGGITQRPERR